MSDKIRFIAGAELEHLQKRIRDHQNKLISANVDNVIDAYLKGHTKEERLKLIAKATQENYERMNPVK
jgi:hypothetical protein